MKTQNLCTPIFAIDRITCQCFNLLYPIMKVILLRLYFRYFHLSSTLPVIIMLVSSIVFCVTVVVILLYVRNKQLTFVKVRSKGL